MSILLLLFLKRARALAETYETHGVITPLEVDENNVIILGERRWRAGVIYKCGENDRISPHPDFKLPVIRKTGLNVVTRLERQLTEESTKSSIKPMEQAWVYATMIVNINDPEHPRALLEVREMEEKLLLNLLATKTVWIEGTRQEGGQAELARKIGKKQSNISNYIKLLKLDRRTQEMINKGDISRTVGREIARINENIRPAVEEEIIGFVLQNKEVIPVKVRELARVKSKEKEAWEGVDFRITENMPLNIESRSYYRSATDLLKNAIKEKGVASVEIYPRINKKIKKISSMIETFKSPLSTDKAIQDLGLQGINPDELTRRLQKAGVMKYLGEIDKRFELIKLYSQTLDNNTERELLSRWESELFFEIEVKEDLKVLSFPKRASKTVIHSAPIRQAPRKPIYSARVKNLNSSSHEDEEVICPECYKPIVIVKLKVDK